MDSHSSTLRRASVLSVLPEPARTSLLERASRASVHRREFIYVPGDASDAIFVIQRGRVRLVLMSDDGREATLEVLEAGDIFGEEALAGSPRRSTGAQAWEETQLVALPAGPVRDALQAEPAALWSFAMLVIERRRAVLELLDGLAFRDVGARLARCLLQLAARVGVSRPNGEVVLRARITHQDLATLVCTTRETITLTLEKFKQEGWLVVQGRSIVLCDLVALRVRGGSVMMDPR
jgi:CRP-like cAMP-binding protein